MVRPFAMLSLVLALAPTGCIGLASPGWPFPSPQDPAVAPPAEPQQPPPARRAASGFTPIQLGLTEDLQLFDRHTAVGGLRFDLWSGDNRAVWGVDVNLGKGNSDGGGGVATSLVWNNASDDFWGVQLAGIYNNVNGAKTAGPPRQHMVGLQVALIVNDAAELDGIQVGAINKSAAAYGMQLGFGSVAQRFTGAQIGMVNFAARGAGLQVAGFNHVDEIVGVQVGLWNQAKSGLQIGLINFNENGFLPVFPFVNF